MRLFLLKVLNAILTVVMVVSTLYAVFNIVIILLPVEIQVKVYDSLHMEREAIAATSISAVVNAAVLVGSKLSQTYTRIALTSELAKSKLINSQCTQSNNVVVDRTNSVISNERTIINLLKAVLEAQKVNIKRNISASEQLVHEDEREAYKQALEVINNALLENTENITSVYEKTEVKEVIVEKLTDHLAGRV